jgi:hypothetical protein
MTSGVGQEAWFRQNLHTITKTQLVFLEYGRGRGRGLTAQHYVDQMLQPIILPFLTAHLGPVLQHDNVWDYMKRKIRARNMYNVHQLRNAIAQEWSQLSAKFLNRLVASMRKRCTELIRVNGVIHTIEKAV